MFLTVNGIRVPVASWKLEYEVVGERARAFSGALHSSRRALKRAWQIDTAMMPQADALALAAILQGEGDCWSFDADAYSAKGNPLSGSGVTQSASKKYGARALQISSGSATSSTFALTPGAPYTLMGWFRSTLSGGSLGVWVLEYDSAGSSVGSHSLTPASSSWTFLSGSWSASASAAQAAVRLLVTGTPTGSAYVDDLAVVPAAVPAEMLTAIEGAGQAYAGPPRVLAEGDLVGAALLCEAEDVRAEGVRYGQHNAGQALSFTLREV